MSKRLLIVIASVFLIIVSFGYYAYKQLVEAGYLSCILSIEDTIGRELGRGAVKGVIVTDDWQTLGEDEEQALFADFRSKGVTFDCYQFARFADGSAFAGTKGQIRFRREGPIIRVRIESDESHKVGY